MKYDVCILGAGPAGLSAAFELQKNDARVIIVERHLVPGNKACGGGLTGDALAVLSRMVLDGSGDGDGAAIMSSLRLEPSHRLTVYSNGSVCFRHVSSMTGFHKNRDYSFPFSSLLRFRLPYMHVSNRMNWQSLVLERLQEKGVRVVSGKRAVGIDGQRVVLSDRHSIRADFTVAADGSQSRIRRQLGLPSAVGAICRQLIVPRSQAENIAIKAPSVWFNPDLFGASYGWVFPYGDQLRIGCGVPATARRSSARLKDAFFSWLSQLNVAWDKGKLEAGSIGCQYAGHRFGHIFLAGDAAGMASSVTGEGIGQAMISGAEVAREILQPNYHSATIPSLAIRHERTFDALAHSRLGEPLYRYAAPLLRIPGLASLAIRKFS